jgi:hypothetical protein
MEQPKERKTTRVSGGPATEEAEALFPVKKVVLSKTGIGYFERYPLSISIFFFF